jgi:hypothetical protein
MVIEFNIGWTLNQSYEFKGMNSLSILRPKTKDEHCWYFIPCINIKEDEDTYAFNRILIQHGAKLKWETRRMGRCWFPSLNVYGMILVFFPLVLNHFSVEWKLLSKVCDPQLNKIIFWTSFGKITSERHRLSRPTAGGWPIRSVDSRLVGTSGRPILRQSAQPP